MTHHLFNYLKVPIQHHATSLWKKRLEAAEVVQNRFTQRIRYGSPKIALKERQQLQYDVLAEKNSSFYGNFGPVPINFLQPKVKITVPVNL